jgi:hypothetical protein
VNLISNTETTKRLKVCCRVDENKYQKDIKITDEELKNQNTKSYLSMRMERHHRTKYHRKLENLFAHTALVFP